MKILKYILSAAALFALGACNHEPDEMVVPTLFPEISKHSAVAVNEVTAGEDFTLVWSAAKFGVETEVEYALSATLVGEGSEALALATTTDCYYTIANLKLMEALGVRASGTINVEFVVTATALANNDVKSSKPVVVTFNYEKVAYVWLLGGYQGWGNDQPASTLLQGEDGIFRGFVNIISEGNGANEIKICTQYGWNGTNYGMKNGVLNTDEDAGNIVLEAGLHYLEFDIDNLSLLDIPITKVGLIGEAVGGWDADYAELKYDATSNTWIGAAQVVSGKAYKVRFNEAWQIAVGDKEYDISLGGDANNLQFAGSDLISSGNGVVSFSLNLFNYPYSIEEGSALEEKNDVLYVASSATNWSYAAAPAMQAQYYDGSFSGQFCGMLDMPTAGEYLFARIQSELGTRYGGSADKLVAYGAGVEATPLSISAGLHYLHTNLQKVTAINITSVGLVGGFNGWDASNPVEFVYDSSSKTYKLSSLQFDGDSDFKIVLNKCWNVDLGGMTHQMSLGGSCTNMVVNGGNLFVTSGEHSFELDFNKTHATLAIDGKIADLSPNPETLSITGAFGHYNWNLGDATPALPLVGDNTYAGIVDMYNPGSGAGSAMFKVTYPNYSAWMGGALRDGTAYTFDLAEAHGDTSLPFGIYHWTITLDARAKTGVATATAVTPTLIGSVNGADWDMDIPLTGNGAGLYTGEVTSDGASEFKVRFNNAWDINLGLASGVSMALNTPLELGLSASNISLLEAGTYTVTINLADMPNTVTISKK